MPNKYRSKFEQAVAADMRKRKCKFSYENEKLDFIRPARKCKYLLDFSLESGIIVECKGRLTAADRKKMLLVKEQNPDRDIRFLFQRASNPIFKGSKTTYAMWAEKNGFLWAESTIPEEWLNE